MHCSSKQQQHVSQFDIFPTALQNAIGWGGGGVGCEIGKALFLGEAKQNSTVPVTKQ
jgi:hypothetical protein